MRNNHFQISKKTMDDIFEPVSGELVRMGVVQWRSDVVLEVSVRLHAIQFCVRADNFKTFTCDLTFLQWELYNATRDQSNAARQVVSLFFAELHEYEALRERANYYYV